MRTRSGLCYPRVSEDKNMRVVKRRRDFAAEQVSYRKRSRNSSDIAGKRDLFDSLPDDLVISILCKLSSSATCPFDFAKVLLTCRRLNGLGLNFLVQIRQRFFEDWRSQLRPDSRQRIVNKIMETLKRHLPAMLCHPTLLAIVITNKSPDADMDNEVIEDDDDINLELFGDELDAPPGFRDRNHSIQVEDEEDEDEDDDNDASGGAFGSHDDIDFNFLHNK
nr:f-box protein [Quercus suber]